MVQKADEDTETGQKIARCGQGSIAECVHASPAVEAIRTQATVNRIVPSQPCDGIVTSERGDDVFAGTSFDRVVLFGADDGSGSDDEHRALIGWSC